MAVALWVLMNINESWHDDAPTGGWLGVSVSQWVGQVKSLTI